MQPDVVELFTLDLALEFPCEIDVEVFVAVEVRVCPGVADGFEAGPLQGDVFGREYFDGGTDRLYFFQLRIGQLLGQLFQCGTGSRYRAGPGNCQVVRQLVDTGLQVGGFDLLFGELNGQFT